MERMTRASVAPAGIVPETLRRQSPDCWLRSPTRTGPMVAVAPVGFPPLRNWTSTFA